MFLKPFEFMARSNRNVLKKAIIFDYTPISKQNT